ncbi:NADH-cytochrome b5 reductase 1 [Smittium culicis]|uniref:NADH-cytochrome b5 reductase 1 n=1 Tax=Smittium culicis TaxID=133412 RepID=A0A1R1X8T2_9FUNG|nr:NADH-cytochrome b5 reductase 1 [Smittium culicis]
MKYSKNNLNKSEIPRGKKSKSMSKYMKLGLGVAGVFSLAVAVNEAVAKIQGSGGYSFFFKDKVGIDPFYFREFKLINKERISHDTSIFRFQIEEIEKKHAFVTDKILNSGVWSIDIKDHYVQTFRRYTPIDYSIVSKNIKDNDLTDFNVQLKDKNETGTKYIDILVKRYPNGSVSRFIHNIDVGEMVQIRGPNVEYPYFLNPKKNIGMLNIQEIRIAGGTGIAPMYQLIKRILLSNDPSNEDKKISLMYASRSKQDILLADQLIRLQQQFPDRLAVHFYVDSLVETSNNRHIPVAAETSKLVAQSAGSKSAEADPNLRSPQLVQFNGSNNPQFSALNVGYIAIIVPPSFPQSFTFSPLT